jgi:hypothetical protein
MLMRRLAGGYGSSHGSGAPASDAGAGPTLFGLLRAGGDVWAALIDVNAVRFGRCARPIFGYQEWCREVAGVSVGELSVTAMRSVVRRYSDACFETARRRR